jgi:putative MATE family efflux protein
MGLDGAAAGAAAEYLRMVLFAAPLLACQVVGVACLRGTGDTKAGMWVMALVNTMNVALSWALVRGVGPLPSLGLAGIGIGTACGEVVGGIVVLGLLARGRAGLTFRLADLRPDPAALRRLLRISLPATGESVTNCLCQLWFLSLISRLGDVATAAHGVAIRCEALAFLTVLAFSVPAGTLTGQYLGAGRPDLAARAARTAWGIGVVVLTGLGAVLYLFAGPMFHLFLGGSLPEVAEMGVPVLRLVAFAMPIFATMTVLTGSLRGAGDTRWPWVIVLFGYFAVRIPLTYVLTTPPEAVGLGLGLYGAWLAMFADLIVRGGLIATRFLSGRWKTVRV